MLKLHYLEQIIIFLAVRKFEYSRHLCRKNYLARKIDVSKCFNSTLLAVSDKSRGSMTRGKLWALKLVFQQEAHACPVLENNKSSEIKSILKLCDAWKIYRTCQSSVSVLSLAMLWLSVASQWLKCSSACKNTGFHCATIWRPHWSHLYAHWHHVLNTAINKKVQPADMCSFHTMAEVFWK